MASISDFWNLTKEFGKEIPNGFRYHGSRISSGIGNFIDLTHGWTRDASGSELTGILDNITGRQAQENIETEWYRDDTRYQRLMADLAAAGINPSTVLGSGGVSPANSGSGSVASNLGTLGALISSIADAGLMSSRRDNLDSQTDKTRAETFKTKLESGILEETGLAQALATLSVTGHTAEEKYQNANKLALEADLYAQKKLTEKEKTTLAEIENKIKKGEFDERMKTGTFSGIMIPFSESQAFGAGIDVSILKNRVGLKGDGSQSTSVSVPIGIIYAAYDKSSPQHDFAIDFISGAFLEDFGSQKKHFTKSK